MADYWGVQNKHAEFDDDKGVSLILVNSLKGKDIFEKISENIDVINTDLDYAISHNPSMIRPVRYNKNRDEFFEKLNNDNLEQLIDKYTKLTLLQRIKNKIRSVLSKVKRKIVK